MTVPATTHPPMTTRPERTEAADSYFTYIDQVGDGDIRQILEEQAESAVGFLRTISEEEAQYRYAPGKWSIREVLGHVNDTERMFVFRALWFARGFEDPLPSFDQDAAARTMEADARLWQSHVDEFRDVRASSVHLFRHLPEEAWSRRGMASGFEFSVRALAYVTAGHVAHHLRILRELYLRNE